MSQLDHPYLQANETAQYRAALAGMDSLIGRDWSWAKTAAAPPPKPPDQHGALMAGIRSVGRGVLGLGADVGGAIGYLGGLTDSEFLKSQGAMITDFWQQQQAKLPMEDTRSVWDDPSVLMSPKWYAEHIGEALPGFAAFLVPSLTAPKVAVMGLKVGLNAKTVARLAQIGAKVAGPAAFGAMDLSATYNDIKARGGSDEDAVAGATQIGLASAALGALNLHYILGEGGRAAARFAKGGLATSVVAFLQGAEHAAILGDDIVSALKETLNSVPALGILGGAAGVALGKPGPGGEPAKPPKPGEPAKPGAPAAAAAPTAVTPPSPGAEAMTARLKAEYEARVAERERAGERPAPTPPSAEGTPAPAVTPDVTPSPEAATRTATMKAQRDAEVQARANPNFRFVVDFLTDGQPKRTWKEWEAKAAEIITANPTASQIELVRVMTAERAGRLATETKAPERPTEKPKPAPQVVAMGQDSVLDATGKLTVGENDRTVLDHLETELSAVENAPAGRRPVINPETGESEGWTGQKTGKGDWLQIREGEPGYKTGKEFYSPADARAVIDLIKAGKVPPATQTLRLRIFDHIMELMKAGNEAILGEGANEPLAPAGPTEAERRVQFFADVEKAAAEIPAPAVDLNAPVFEKNAKVLAGEAPPLTDWQQRMVEIAEQAQAAPETGPQAAQAAQGSTIAPEGVVGPKETRTPGFAHPYGGPEGTVGTLLREWKNDIHAEAARIAAKRGVVGDDQVRDTAHKMILDGEWDAERVLNMGKEDPTIC